MSRHLPSERAVSLRARLAAPASTSARTPASGRATCRTSWTPCWRAGSTSSSCGTRAWRPRRSWSTWQSSRDACARHGALLAVNDRADVAHAVRRRRAAPRPGRPAGPRRPRDPRRRHADRPLHARRRARPPRPPPSRASTTSAPAPAGPPRPSPAAPPRASTWCGTPRRWRAARPVVRDRRHRPRQPRRGAATRAPAGSWSSGRSPRRTTRARRPPSSRAG